MLENFILLQSQQAENGSAWPNLLMIAAIVLVFWLFFIRPQSKRQKEIRNFRNSLQKGDKVMVAGGIRAKIVDIKDDYYVVEIANNVKIDVDKEAVYAMPAPAPAKGEKK